MAKMFESVSVADRPTSQFNGNHTVMHTQRMSELMPIKCINFYPGDKFYGKMGTVFNFPPLLAPAYQRFSLKQYAFRVRKALTWSNDALGKYLISMSDGKSAPSQPFINGNDQFFFGTSVCGLKFNPQIPVYGTIQDGKLLVQATNLPNFLTLNHIMFGSIPTGVNVDSITRSLVANMFSFDVKDFEQDPWKLSMYSKNTGFTSDGTSISYGSDDAQTITIKSSQFQYFGLDEGVWSDRFCVKPLCHEGSLLEGLGYPTSGIHRINSLDYYDPNLIDDKQVNGYQYYFNIKVNSFINAFISLVQSNQSASIDLDYLKDDDAVNGALNVDYNNVLTGVISIRRLLLSYIHWAISHGHGDGSIPTSDEVPFMYLYYNKNFFKRPQIASNKSYKFDAGRLTSYWLVYDEYFRDASLSDPFDFEPVRISNSSFFNSCFSMLGGRFGDASNGIVNDNSDLYKRFGIDSYYKVKRNAVSEELVRMYFSTTPYKLLDKDWFSSVMPWTTRIEVFAPTISGEQLDSSAPDKQGTVDSIKRITPNQFTPNTGNINGDPDFSPRDVKDSVVSAFSNAFVSVDAFRTAELLQQFFRDASLCGNKPVTWVLVNFGVHSADFRHEVPTLVDISESPISITELTQSSETSELPIGSEAGKMYCSNNGLNINVDSVGECGYIIFMNCVYPETELVNGLNPEIEAQNPWRQMFLPQFAQLGEEAIPRKYFSFVAGDNVNNGELESDYGFTPRFSRFKQQVSEVHGRFNTDMKHWHLQRMSNPLSILPTLNQQNIESPVDLRLFASDEIANCYGITYFNLQFERKLTPKIYTQLT